MDTPGLTILSPEKLVARLNVILPENSSVYADCFVQKIPRKPGSFLCPDEKHETYQSLKSILYQNSDRLGIAAAILEMKPEDKVGYIFVETGEIKGDHPNAGTPYESLRMVIKKYLDLRGEKTLPICSVKIMAVTEELMSPNLFRRDHIRSRTRLWWTKSDLSYNLPDSSFLATSLADCDMARI